jgi:hypothetical protein
MALTNCPDCQTCISTRALLCLGCGRQLAPAIIEKTSKGIKAAIAVGSTCILLSPAAIVYGCASGSQISAITGCLLFPVGLALYAGASFLKWWRHGKFLPRAIATRVTAIRQP